MKHALFTGTVLVLVASAATTARAQFRGRLTSQTPVPAIVSRPVLPSLLALPLWSPWGIVTLPESEQIGPPAIGQGAQTGGLQIDIQPWSAEVYVDGARAGRVEQFRGYYQHLDLPAGPHTIALVANGYEPMVFGVMVMPGKTITYRATLQR
jgi:PEGA domain-containing protein